MSEEIVVKNFGIARKRFEVEFRTKGCLKTMSDYIGDNFNDAFDFVDNTYDEADDYFEIIIFNCEESKEMIKDLLELCNIDYELEEDTDLIFT